MTQVRISELPAADALTGVELLPVVQGGATKRAPASSFATAAQGALADTAVQPGDLGTAAALDAGTGAGDLVQLDGSGRLPAVDGSQLTGLGSGGTVTSVDVAGTGGISSSGGPVTSSGTITVTIADGALALGKIADIATGHFLGRVASGSGPVAALSASQVRTGLNVADGATANAAATTAEVRALTATGPFLTPGNVGAAMDIVTLTDAANIAWDMAGGFTFKVTLGGNRTLDFPTNIVAGKTGWLLVAQDATGGRTLSVNASYDEIDGDAVADALSTTANAETLYVWAALSSSRVLLRPVGVLA